MRKADKEAYHYEPHSFIADKHCGKPVCTRCGLIGLRNKATEWCIDKGCGYKNHTSYPTIPRHLTKNVDF